MTRALVSALLLLLSSFAYCDDALTLFKQANNHYQKQEYTDAVKLYQQIEATGQVSPELYLNLGKTQYRLGKIGKAVLAYERGLALKPNHTELIKDLDIVKGQIESDIYEVPAFGPVRLWKNFTKSLPSIVWIMLQFLGLGIIIYMLSRRWLQPNVAIPTSLNIATKICAVIAIISSLALLSRWYDDNHNIKAVVLDRTALYNGPDERSGDSASVPEGEKVMILDNFGDWWKVRLLNHEEGYIAKAAAEKI